MQQLHWFFFGFSVKTLSLKSCHCCRLCSSLIYAQPTDTPPPLSPKTNNTIKLRGFSHNPTAGPTFLPDIG